MPGRDFVLFYEMYVSPLLFLWENVIREDVDNNVSTVWECDRVRDEKEKKDAEEKKRKRFVYFPTKLARNRPGHHWDPG